MRKPSAVLTNTSIRNKFAIKEVENNKNDKQVKKFLKSFSFKRRRHFKKLKKSLKKASIIVAYSLEVNYFWFVYGESYWNSMLNKKWTRCTTVRIGIMRSVTTQMLKMFVFIVNWVTTLGWCSCLYVYLWTYPPWM